MASLDEITERLRQAVGADSGLGATCKFDFKGEGFIFIDRNTVTNDDKPADCTLIVSKSDFEQMGQGKLDPTMAFMQGKLKINGDMGVAMRLQPLLAKVRDS